MFFLFAACTEPTCEVGNAPADSSALLLPQVTSVADTPVHRVAWSTPAATSGQVNYGVDDLELRIEDDVIGTEHEVFVAGIGAGQAWHLQASSQAGESVWTSEVIEVEAVPAPTEMPLPELTVAPGDEISGFELLPVPSGSIAYITVLNRMGLPAWWRQTGPLPAYRARYNAADPTISWIEGNDAGQAQDFVTSTLDGVETRVPVPPNVHHDFALLSEGGIVALVYSDREIEGVKVRGESLQEIAPDGTAFELWNSWDTFDWPGNGKINTDGSIEWPHANSLDYDPVREKILISLFYLDGIIQIDRATGLVDWVLGGSESDWLVEGEAFGGQHGPQSFEDGNGLTLMNNGHVGGELEAGIAMAYDLDLDTLTATPRWTFDHDQAYSGIILGNVAWLGDETVAVNWGSAAVLERVNLAGEVRWQVSYRLGSFTMFNDHLAEFAGATR